MKSGNSACLGRPNHPAHTRYPRQSDHPRYPRYPRHPGPGQPRWLPWSSCPPYPPYPPCHSRCPRHANPAILPTRRSSLFCCIGCFFDCLFIACLSFCLFHQSSVVERAWIDHHCDSLLFGWTCYFRSLLRLRSTCSKAYHQQ